MRGSGESRGWGRDRSGVKGGEAECCQEGEWPGS